MQAPTHEEIRDKNRYTIHTDFNEYIVYITSYTSGKVYIEVFDEEPYDGIFDLLMRSLFDEQKEPIATGYVGKYGNWQKKIQSLIFEHEYPIYQHMQLQQSDPYMYIDHADEAKKRRPKKQQQEHEEVELQQPQPQKDIIYNDYQIPEPMVIRRSERVKTNGKDMHINSLNNLPQFNGKLKKIK